MKRIALSVNMCASLAQLDRVFGYEPKGRGFESLTTRQQKSNPFGLLFCCCFVTLEPLQARKGLNWFAPAETCEVCTNRRANRGSESPKDSLGCPFVVEEHRTPQVPSSGQGAQRLDGRGNRSAKSAVNHIPSRQTAPTVPNVPINKPPSRCRAFARQQEGVVITSHECR